MVDSTAQDGSDFIVYVPSLSYYALNKTFGHLSVFIASGHTAIRAAMLFI